MNTIVKIMIGVAALIAAVSMMITSLVNGITSLKTMKILKDLMPKYDRVMDLCIDSMEPDKNVE